LYIAVAGCRLRRPTEAAWSPVCLCVPKTALRPSAAAA
jgi:hypothetical protein